MKVYLKMSLESLVRGDFRNILPNGYCKKSFSNGRHWKIMKRRHFRGNYILGDLRNVRANSLRPDIEINLAEFIVLYILSLNQSGE